MDEEITLEKLLAGELDPGTIGIGELKAFCMEHELTAYEVTSEREMSDMLNEIAELLAPSKTTTAPELMTVREYAEAYGIEVAEVKKLTGLTRVDQKVTPKLHAKMHGPAIDPEPTQLTPVTEVHKKPLSRRERMIERGKVTKAMKAGNTKGVQFPPHKYTQLANAEYDKLPGRIRRSVEAQAGPRNSHEGFTGE